MNKCPVFTSSAILVEEGLDIELADVLKRGSDVLVIPVPPGDRFEALGNVFRKTVFDDTCGHTGNNRKIRHVLCHDGTGRDHGSDADVAAWENDGPVSDSCVVTDVDGV